MRLLFIALILFISNFCNGQSVEKCRTEIFEFKNIFYADNKEWYYDKLEFIGDDNIFETLPSLKKNQRLIYLDRVRMADKIEIKAYQKRLQALYDIVTMKSQNKPTDPRKINDTTFIFKNIIWERREIVWSKKAIIPILIEDENKILVASNLTEIEKEIISRMPSISETGISTNETKYFPFFQKPVLNNLSTLKNKLFDVADYGKTFKSKDIEFNTLYIDDESDEPTKSYESTLFRFLKNFTTAAKKTSIEQLIDQLQKKDFSFFNTFTNQFQKAENKIIAPSPKLDYATLICRTANKSDTFIITTPTNINSSFIKGNYLTYLYFDSCLTKSKKEFSNKTLPKDYYSNPKLKTDLLNALKKSLRFKDFTILSIVLLDNSEWKLSRLNQYSTIVDKRELFAGAYVKSKITDKCYYLDNILFQQKNDLVRGFIYPIEAFDNPEYAEEYPCNLKQ